MAKTITQTTSTNPNETETSWVKARNGVMNFAMATDSMEVFIIARTNHVFGSGR